MKMKPFWRDNEHKNRIIKAVTRGVLIHHSESIYREMIDEVLEQKWANVQYLVVIKDNRSP